MKHSERNTNSINNTKDYTGVNLDIKINKCSEHRPYSENQLPLVSIIVPSYNHEKYINECIVSIINQTYKNYELIVIDDGSTDNSPTILRELQHKYKFKLICQENIGLPATLNKGIKISNGKYYTFCASDDYWTDFKLEKQVSFMENNPDVPLSYGRMIRIDGSSSVIKIKQNSNFKGGYIFNELFLMNFHPPVSYMFRKDIFNKVGYYDENLKAEDFDMNLRIAHNYPIGFIDDTLGYYRIHENHSAIIDSDNVLNSHKHSIIKYKDHPLYSKAIGYWRIRKVLKISINKKRKIEAFLLLWKAKKFFYRKEFIYGLYRIFFVWKI